MPEFSWNDLIDKAKAEGGTREYTPVDPGEYDFVITQAEGGESAKGKDQWALRTRIVSGENRKRLVFHTFYLSPESPKALDIFFRHFAILGLDAEFFATGPSKDQIAEALVGKAFRGVLKVETYNNKERNAFQDFRTPTESGLAAAKEYLTEFPVEGQNNSGGGSSAPATPSATPSSPSASPSPTPAPATPSAARPTPPVPPTPKF